MKPCKGINKAKGFEGCGELSDMRQCGLCPSCLYSWATTTEAGREWHKARFLPRVKKKMASNIKKDRAKAKKRLEFEMLSPNKYREKYVQPRINLLARMIDNGHPCIANETYGKMNGGHFYSVGSNVTLSLNLHNIHIQSFESNHWQSGDVIKYRSGLIRVYGQEYLEFIEGLKTCPPLNLSKEELRDIHATANALINELKKQEVHLLPPKDRIRLRNATNEALGIYGEMYSQFNLK